VSKFKGKYRIESTRAQWWDYANAGGYFITICTHNRNHYFGSIENTKMNLSRIGIIADLCWQEINNRRNYVELGAYVIMPNHIHGILKLNDIISDNDDNVNNVDNVADTRHALYLPETETETKTITEPTKTPGQKRFRNPGKNTISSIIGSYKSAVTKHAHRFGFDFAWQSRFHDHIIRNQGEYQRIEKYIIENPSKWLDDRFYL
jgi:putative transposase